MLRGRVLPICGAPALCLGLLLACPGLSAQTFSHVLSFQGRLCATDGRPVPDGPYIVTFRMYATATGGAALWTENQGVTQVGGVFVTYLGSVTPFPANLFSDGDRWLGIAVGGDPEMAQRSPLTPSPWAVRAAEADHATSADNADKVDGIHASATPTPDYLLPLDGSGRFPASVIPPDDDWMTSGGDIYRLNGNVGIGTSAPSAKLHIAVGSTGTSLYAKNTDSGSYGILGETAYGVRAGGQTFGVFGQHDATGNYGWLGSANSGVSGVHAATQNAGYLGLSACGVIGSADSGHGVIGQSWGGEHGVHGEGYGDGIGVWGSNEDYGPYGYLGGPEHGVYGCSEEGDAGYFEGDATVTGNLTVSGSALLTPPLSLSGSSAEPTIKGANSGNGEGLKGEGTNGYGVYGYSTNNIGLFGYSVSATGVSGYAPSRGGVEGLNGNWGNVGRLGTDDYGAYGESTRSSAYGVYGKHTPSGNYGFVGSSLDGVQGRSSASNGSGVAGVHSGNGNGVYGSSSTGHGLSGKQGASGNYGYVGTTDYGVEGYGNTAGGCFQDATESGRTIAGYGNVGVAAYGTQKGGEFRDSDDGSWADIASGRWGIYARGTQAGGNFGSTDGGGYSYLGIDNYGIEAYGAGYAGHFLAYNDYDQAWVAGEGRGIWAEGLSMGGHFGDIPDGSYAEVAVGAYKIKGTGTVSFVQNHPMEQDRVIVYACPEGDEVATYTRGTARLVNGAAHVPLGETFKWVTNPDIGLTAHLTLRGDSPGVYVESLTTEEMVVREVGGGASNVAFDYIVYGLRIGFEEMSIVQEKEREAYIPSMEPQRNRYREHPELRQYNALERFKTMRASVGDAGPLDLTRSHALHDAIVEFDPAIHRADRPDVRERP